MSTLELRQRTLQIVAGSPSNITGAFLIDRQARGLSSRTVDYYREKLEKFCTYLEDQGVIDLEEVTPDVLRKYFLVIGARSNRGGVHAHFRAIRAMLRWYEDEFEPDNWKNPIKKVKIPGPNTEPLPGIAVHDVYKMVDVCVGARSTRDRAILLCLLDTGARASEFINLNIGDVDLIRGDVRILHGKGGKTRVVYLGTKSRKALRKYLRERSELLPTSPLFVTDEGDRVAFSGLVSLIRRRAANAGIAAPGLHDFRRCFAVESLRNGMDLVSLSRLMGHYSVVVTQRYLHLVEDDLAIAHRKHGPVDHSGR
jgi:integrase/recombinase XerD